MSDRPATNPYLGPHPFEPADRDRFFGRTLEIRQLASLVVARRVVVLYARSGAGKTSLLRAGLIPYLEEHKRLRVLPISRVRGELPAGTGHRAVANRYVLNILLSLFGDGAEPGELIGLSLAKGLERLCAASSEGGGESPRLLILDQFEELFSTYPELHEQRAELFSQLQTSLDELPQLSLLLSLREDWVASLDPYAALLPDRLRSRFRLELLGQVGARQAIQLPSRRAGGELSDAAAQALVDDLRTVRVQQPDGGTRDVLGPWVEPVHLQVVCTRLWSRTMADSSGGRWRIEESDLRAAGSVDSALGAYYDQQVKAVARLTGAGERILRDFIQHRLITDQGIRGQVLQGVERTHGLANPVLQALVDARLVRCEKRRGATWLELAHDRLVEPVRSSNAEWRQANLRSAQLQAALWTRRGRPPGLLLSGDTLGKELSWASAHAGELSEDEQDFLAASRQARDAATQARRVRRFRWLILAVVLVLAGVLWQLRQESAGRRRELARGLASQALSQIDEQLDLALLLSLEANRLGASAVEVRGSLLTGLLYQPRLLSFLHGHQATVWTVAFSPVRDPEGRRLLASGGQDHRVQLWDVDRHEAIGEPLEGHKDWVLSLAWSPDGRRLVSTGRDRRVVLWELYPRPRIKSDFTHDRIVSSVVFDPDDGDRLIGGDTGNEIFAWDLSQDPPQATSIGRQEGLVTSLALSLGAPGVVVSGSADGYIRVWTGEASTKLSGHTDWVADLAWSPAGDVLASAGLDRTVRRWDMRTLTALGELEGPEDRMSSVAFSPDATLLAAATANGVLYLWDAATGVAAGPWLAGNLAPTRSLTFSPDGDILAAGNGSAVALWDLADLGAEGPAAPGPQRLGRLVAGVRGAVRSVAFSPEGSRLAAGVSGSSGKVWLLDAVTGEARGGPLTGHSGPQQSVAFGLDDATLLTFGDDGEQWEIRRWDLAEPSSKSLGGKRLGDAIGRDRKALATPGDYAGMLAQALGLQGTEECLAVRVVARTSGGKLWAAEGLRGGVKAWHLDAPRAYRRGALVGTDCVRSVAIDPGGETLAAGGDEGTVEILSLAEVETVRRLPARASTGDSDSTSPPPRAHQGAVRSLAFSSDGETLASGGDDGIIRLWEVSTGTPRGILVGHTDSVYALAFDPRDRILASSGRDRTVMLWDVDTGIAMGRPLRGHAKSVRSLAWSSDGERLASGGDDGLWLWELGFEAWRDHACRIANRNLTQCEWDLFVGAAITHPDELACPGAGAPQKCTDP